MLYTLFYPFSVRFGCVKGKAEEFEIGFQTIRPILDDMFDFEKTIAGQTEVDPDSLWSAARICILDHDLLSGRIY